MHHRILLLAIAFLSLSENDSVAANAEKSKLPPTAISRPEEIIAQIASGKRHPTEPLTGLGVLVGTDVSLTAIVAALANYSPRSDYGDSYNRRYSTDGASAIARAAKERGDAKTSFVSISIARLANVRPSDSFADSGDAYGVSGRMLCDDKSNGLCLQWNPIRTTNRGDEIFVTGTVTDSQHLRSFAWFRAARDHLSGYIAASNNPIRMVGVAGDAASGLFMAVPLPPPGDRQPNDVRRRPHDTSVSTGPPPAALASDSSGDRAPPELDRCANPAKPVVIPIAVQYTARAEQRMVNDGLGVGDRIDTAETLTNHSLAAGNISASINVIDVSKISAVEGDPTNHAWFDSIFDDIESSSPQKWGDFLKRKKAVGAAIGILIVDVDDPTACGLSSGYRVDAQHAYSIVNWRCLEGRYSFAHEIGHLVGIWHDSVTRFRESIPDSDVWPPYAQGFVSSAPNTVASIMAYVAPCAPCARINLWSDPNRREPYYGHTFGDPAASNEVCVWRARAAAVAAFAHQRHQEPGRSQ